MLWLSFEDSLEIFIGRVVDFIISLRGEELVWEEITQLLNDFANLFTGFLLDEGILPILETLKILDGHSELFLA